MLRHFVTIAIIFLSIPAASQSSNKEIIAEGGAKIKVLPDLVTFTLTIEKQDTIEAKVLQALNKEVDDLTKCLFKIGFQKENIKISDYAISTSRNEQEKKRYAATSILKLEFWLNTKTIDALYKEIQHSEIEDLDVSFETRLSDSLERETRFRLVQTAIKDAKSNAVNIANTLNIKLVQVKQVLKSNDGLLPRPPGIYQVQFTPPKIVRDTEISYSTSFDKFQVEGVELEEKITLVFEIGR